MTDTSTLVQTPSTIELFLQEVEQLKKKHMPDSHILVHLQSKGLDRQQADQLLYPTLETGSVQADLSTLGFQPESLS